MQGREAVGLQRNVFCRGCSPHAPLTISHEPSGSVHFLTSVGAHGAPYLTLEASLRGYPAEEFIQFKHVCQSPQCARTTKFKEVPTHLFLVIQRVSLVSQPGPAPAMCHIHTQLACTGCLQMRLPVDI